MLAAHVRKLITARARKNKRTARMLANAGKDHSIPLMTIANCCANCVMCCFTALLVQNEYTSICNYCGWHFSVRGQSVKRFEDVRAYFYCAFLVRTLYMTWHVPRHVFQARASSRNSIKYRAGDLCGNLICEYFYWIIGDPHFFFGRSLSFLILSIILKNKKICVCEVLIISYILFK